MAELLAEWTDPVLGPFEWDVAGRVWNGACEFRGRVVPLQLDPDRREPNRQEQMAVFEPARVVLARLREAEPGLRRQAAEQIAAAVTSQQDDGPGLVTLPQARFADELELEAVSIHGCGELYYRSHEFFPGSLVTVYFENDLSFGDAEV